MGIALWMGRYDVFHWIDLSHQATAKLIVLQHSRSETLRFLINRSDSTGCIVWTKEDNMGDLIIVL